MRVSNWIGLPLLAVVMISMAAAPTVAQEPVRRSVDGLEYDLQHPEQVRRLRAARLLGQNKVHAAVPALIAAAADRDDDVRLEVIKALVRIHDRRALTTYVALTRDGRPDIQEKSIEGIINTYVSDESGFVRGLQNVVDFVNPFSDDYNPLTVESFIEVDPAAIDAVGDLLLSERAHIRKDAAAALGILRARTALPAILDALEQESETDVTVELIRTVYKVGDPAVGGALVPRVLDADKQIHDEAIFTAGRLRVTEAVPSLVDMIDAGVEERRTLFGFVPISGSNDLSRRVLEALAYIGDARAQHVFLAWLDSDRGWSRRFSAEGLGRIGDTAHLSHLTARYQEEEADDVRLALAFARYRLGEAQYLQEVVGQATADDQAYGYLMELAPQEMPALYSYVRNESEDVRLRLLEVIGMRGDRSAIDIAEEMIQTGSPKVREAANLAVLRIRGRYPEA